MKGRDLTFLEAGWTARDIPRGPGGPFRLLRLSLVQVVAALVLATAACTGGGTGEGGLSVNFRLDPQPPEVGTAQLDVSLFDAAGAPVTGATIAVEANMSHAGMKPSFADLPETGSGHYAGAVEFTMGGDWFLTLTVTKADGTKVERTFPVPNVQSP